MSRWKKAKVLVIAATSFMLSACFDLSSNNSNNPEQDSGIYFDLSAVDYSAITVGDSLLAAGSRLFLFTVGCKKLHSIAFKLSG